MLIFELRMVEIRYAYGLKKPVSAVVSVGES